MKTSEIKNKLMNGYALRVMDNGVIFHNNRRDVFVTHNYNAESGINLWHDFKRAEQALQFMKVDTDNVVNDDFVECGFVV